jgi:hypothetical protein
MLTPIERWEDIFDICATIIAEDSLSYSTEK